MSSSPLLAYRIIEFFTVFSALAELLVCRKCKQAIRFEETSSRGLGFKLVVICKCGKNFIQSGPFVNTGYEINRRIVLVMRLLGVANEGINLFCNFMDLCKGLSQSSYDRILDYLHTAISSVFSYCCEKAVEEEKKENEKNERPLLHLKVSGDGSWRKRGFQSLFGVTTLIGYYSGKIIDLLVKSSMCVQCDRKKKELNTEEFLKWYDEHKEDCTRNHEGSAGKMEVDSVLEMFQRSEEQFGVKYSNYVGDGDSKTFKALLDAEPYGKDLIVTKSECIGHVQKRMGSRLRNLKKTQKLSGKGKLTDALIKKLTLYYGLAIRRNIDSVENMKKAIFATYYHMCSTDKEPNHTYCPSGVDSWCHWKKAEAMEVDPTLIPHPAPLHPDVKEHLLPIYEDLSKDDLLNRCLGGHTQNANESFNNLIWRLAPKHLHSGSKTVEISAYIAAGVFNEGLSTILRVMNAMEIIVGKQSLAYAQLKDSERIQKQDTRTSLASQEARKARKELHQTNNQMYEDIEGLLYAPGIAD